MAGDGFADHEGSAALCVAVVVSGLDDLLDGLLDLVGNRVPVGLLDVADGEVDERHWWLLRNVELLLDGGANRVSKVPSATGALVFVLPGGGDLHVY